MANTNKKSNKATANNANVENAKANEILAMTTKET